MCKVLDEEEVTLADVGNHLCKFTVPGKVVPQVFVVASVPTFAQEFVHMLEALVKECEAVHALPSGASAKRAVKVLQLVLVASSEKRAACGRVNGSGGGLGGGRGKGCRVEKRWVRGLGVFWLPYSSMAARKRSLSRRKSTTKL